MKSIKAKFTFTLTLVLFGIITLFAAIVYFSSVYRFENRITPEVINNIAKNNPKLKIALQKINQNQTLSEVFNNIQADQSQQYATTILILIPLSLIFSTIIAYLISSYLLKPINDLALNIRKIDSDRISTRIPLIKSSSEIEYLIMSFNILLDEVEQSFRSQDQFISDAAHELRTPVAAMKTSIQVFHEGKDNTKEDYEKLLTIVERINNKLQKLNENLLFLNSKNRSKYSFEKVDILRIIEDTLESILYLCQSKIYYCKYSF